ncbi:MAG: hypothetical protein GXO85_08465 [Chlorobi bacterium]|nr:hypothetical protein [Chlorobiota bacterium]
MKFKIVMGIPDMIKYWERLCKKADSNKLGNDLKLFKKLVKTLSILSNNPKHPGLKSHEIKPLTKRYGIKVWQSYLESKTPSAGRIFWVYGPEEKQITIIGIEPHPEEKKRGGYDKIKLSDLN